MKLPLLIIATAIAIAVVASLTASRTAYVDSERRIKSHLSVIASGKCQQLASFMQDVRNDLQTIAGNPATQRLLDGFSIGFKLLPEAERAGLTTRFAGDIPPKDTVRGLSDFYGASYQELHPWFRTFGIERGYEDILFVDRDDMLVYSMAKNSDFGHSAVTGELAASALGEAVRKARGLKPGQVAYVDFRYYAPMRRPVAFAAMPIHQKLGRKLDYLGVLVLPLPAGRIDTFFNADDGFGNRGEAMILGADGLMRTNSRFGPRKDVLTTRYADPAFNQVRPEGGVAYTAPYRGGHMISAFLPYRTNGLDWVVVATENTEDVFAPANDMVFSIVTTCLAATVLLTLAASLLSRRMAKPIVELSQRFETALANIPHGLCIVDENNRVVLTNAAYCQMYNLPLDIGQESPRTSDMVALRSLVGTGPADFDNYQSLLTRFYRAQSTDEERVALQNGRTVTVTTNPIPSGGYVATHQDITEAIAAEAKIRYMAAHDALTNLPNRSLLLECMEAALEHRDAGTRLAILFIDLDHFKSVNDTLGHPVGDMLLKATTVRLSRSMRPTDMIARIGGDEFVVLQRDVAGPRDAEELARGLIAQMTEPFVLDKHQVVIGASIGIALAPIDGTEVDTLLRNADMALYRAKGDGRNTFRFFEPQMDEWLQTRRELELDLRRALANAEFELYFQPLVSARDQRIGGFEALLRWRHPTRGFVSPGEFIPLAEEIGLIAGIGEWVIHEACAEAARWPAAMKIAVNLSPVQFKSATLALTVVSAMEKAGLSPHRLELEITESALLAQNPNTLEMLHQFRNLGVRIAMDDFGTGYSSLSYLRSFPFDKIKIDKGFIQDLSDKADSAAIIKAVADLGAALGMTTTAEGVETAEQFQQVRALGCTEVQGYYFSAPVPASRIPELLQQAPAPYRAAI